MTGEQFRAALEILYGAEWAAAGAEYLDMSQRNVRRFANGDKAIGAGLAQVVVVAVRVALATPSRSSPAIEIIRMAQGTQV